MVLCASSRSGTLKGEKEAVVHIGLPRNNSNGSTSPHKMEFLSLNSAESQNVFRI